MYYCSNQALPLLILAIVAWAGQGPPSAAQEPSTQAVYFAEGVKIGEVTSDSAILWMRLCATDICDEAFQLPGKSGEVRVVYHSHSHSANSTEWVMVGPESDFAHQFALVDLAADQVCHYTVEARTLEGDAAFTGEFRTAPVADTAAGVRFVVTTGHSHATAESQKRGHKIYPSMGKLQPSFFVHTGDVVYYDRDTAPDATTPELARLHWHRLYSLPRQKDFHRTTPSYFIKDDHDILKDDCWPGQTYGELTFDQGVELFDEQTPSSPLPYRTFRWGKHLQVWLVEGREYRSPNKQEDGPDKSIWGIEQREWFRKGLTESDATFKVLISPTPIVGPDRASKHDNHCNDDFQHEGDIIRKLLASQKNAFVVCGDRHWQYVSVDPKTQVREYSCGPSTNRHSGGWKQDDLRPEHQFLRVAGGFLDVEVSAGQSPTITFRLHDVDGNVMYEESANHQGVVSSVTQRGKAPRTP